MRFRGALVRGIGVLGALFVVCSFVARSGATPGDDRDGPRIADVGGSEPTIHPQDVLRKIDRRTAGGLIVLPHSAADRQAAGESTLAPYFYVAGGDESVDRLPLKETSARIHVAGPIAHVEVRQLFENQGRQPIEAVYVFPASTRAAVHGMRMTIGERTIEARIDERQRARQAYEQARAEGRRASLLEQQRPNVFTTSVANVMPRDRIEVTLRYSELIVPEDATYELVYPAVVGPRYAGGADPERDGWIGNPHLGPGQREPYRFDVTAHIESALPIRAVSSPSHALTTSFASPRNADIRLAAAGGGNRDFVLRWQLAGDAIEAGLLRFEDAGERFFLLQVEPPARPRAASIPPREYIFVLDVSGSMAGFPLDTTKALMRRLLGALRPIDSFNVVLFAGGSSVLGPNGSLAATPANVASAIQQIEQLRGGGGTELMGGLRTAYGLPPRAEGTSRSVVLVTDGYVAVESQAFRFVRERLHEGNLFALGIGSSVNRALIEGLARAGDGEPFVVLGPENAAAAAARFQRYIQTPVLTDVAVRFEGLTTRDVTTEGLADLMAARPIVVLGRYEGPARGTIVVSGRNGEGEWSRRIDVAAGVASAAHAPIRHLFARKWVDVLEDRLHVAPNDQELQGAITSLGLRYRLLTPFTSFVAVDSAVVNRTGDATSVRQPLPLPQGVPATAVGGGFDALMAGALGGPRAEAQRAAAPAPAPASADHAAPLAQLSSQQGGRAQSPGESAFRVTRSRQDEVQRCYDRLVPAQLRRDLLVRVRFVIGPTGAVLLANAIGFGNERVEQCVVSAVRRWRFPAPPGGQAMPITYPFRLRAPSR